ncbi:MAG: thioredoxin family protein [Candidatus Woesearchaeota archaeon]
MKTVTREEFLQIIKKDKEILVDFYADWCGKCKDLEVTLEKYEDNFDVIKVNIEKCPELARKYEIEKLPQLLLFRKGKLIARQGASSYAFLKKISSE